MVIEAGFVQPRVSVVPCFGAMVVLQRVTVVSSRGDVRNGGARGFVLGRMCSSVERCSRSEKCTVRETCLKRDTE